MSGLGVISPSAFPAVLAVAALMVGGCALDNRDTATSSVQTTAPPPAEAFGGEAPSPPPTNDRIPPVGARWLETNEVDGLGAIVVDGVGRTVYASSTEAPGRPACYDACADTWLPLLTSGDPAGGIGIQVAEVGTAPRRDGNEQVTYQGHPLYWYAGDSLPGQINGHGLDLFGAQWYALTPDGDRAGVG